MQPIVTDRVLWSVGQSVCHNLGPCNTAEPIEMPFEVWIRMGPRNCVLVGVQNPKGRSNFGENVICTANGWLKEEINNSSTTEYKFWRNAGPSAFHLRGTTFKSDKTWCRPTNLVINCISLRTFWTPVLHGWLIDWVRFNVQLNTL